MAVVSQEPIQRPVPHEPGEWFEFYVLSDKKLRKAKRAAKGEQMETIRALGAEIFKAMQSSDPDAVKRARARAREFDHDISNYDVPTLLRLGIAGWSYKVKLGNDPSDQLDSKTAEWAAQEILDLTRPPSEEELGNSSGGSSST